MLLQQKVALLLQMVKSSGIFFIQAGKCFDSKLPRLAKIVLLKIKLKSIVGDCLELNRLDKKEIFYQ